MLEFRFDAEQAHPWDTPPMDVTSSSGQVSWLAGRRFCPAFPTRIRASGMGDSGSPPTVAGAAPEWMVSHRTGFPLRFLIFDDSEEP
jgi:hypothetical protein